jgi:hypothetical protein
VVLQVVLMVLTLPQRVVHPGEPPHILRKASSIATLARRLGDRHGKPKTSSVFLFRCRGDTLGALYTDVSVAVACGIGHVATKLHFCGSL